MISGFSHALFRLSVLFAFMKVEGQIRGMNHPLFSLFSTILAFQKYLPWEGLVVLKRTGFCFVALLLLCLFPMNPSCMYPVNAHIPLIFLCQYKTNPSRISAIFPTFHWIQQQHSHAHGIHHASLKNFEKLVIG